MTSYSTIFEGTFTALSSIAHGGQTRGLVSLLRREQFRLPDGRTLMLPLVSGNAVRGHLRRIGEELTRCALDYEGQIPLSAAHVLRAGGGSLAKTTREPLSGSRLRDLRALVPQFLIFGGSAGRTYSGALSVGKALPHLEELEHLTGHPGPGAFAATQLETYGMRDETSTTQFHALTGLQLDPDGSVDLTALPEPGAGSMLYRIETFPAGTLLQFQAYLSLVPPLAHAFFLDVLAEHDRRGHLGGHAATGLGRTRLHWSATTTPGPPPPVDWRAHLAEHRQEAIDALGWLA